MGGYDVQDQKEIKMPRGYFGIGVENMKTDINYGTLFRTANIFGASFIFLVGRRFKKQLSDTMRSERHIPLFEYETFDEFYGSLPYDCKLIGVELIKCATPLSQYKHPERAVYLLGAEDNGLSGKAMGCCHEFIVLPGDTSLNVSVAGSIVLYDRIAKGELP